MAERDKRRWRSLSPAEIGVVVGVIAFLSTMLIPATYSARCAGKRPSNRRDALTPGESKFLEYVERNWTEEAVLPKALGIGLLSGIVAAAAGPAARLLKCRRAGRGG